MFYIDEVRYIIQDAVCLAFLEEVFRHHRYHVLLIHLIMQAVDESLNLAESEAILD